MTANVQRPDFESPSLFDGRGRVGPAFELKFLVPLAQAQLISDWASRHMTPDPHGDPRLDGAYHTSTLYLDTPGRDVYYRSIGHRRRKFRVRRYGTADAVYLERKTRVGDRVAKRRVAVPHTEIVRLASPMSLVDWPGHWFHRSVLLRRLQPAALITYERRAFQGSGTQGNMRLTLDRDICGTLASEWLTEGHDRIPLLESHAIVEFKFHGSLPTMFKELAQKHGLSPTIVSKYRLCCNAWGASSVPNADMPARRSKHA